MAHVFNFHTFATLIRQIDRIIEGARDQERRLARVVSRFESVDHLSAETSMEGPTTASRGHELTTIADRDQGSVLLARLREICIHERQQRQIAEALAISLVGEVATRDAVPSGRRHVLIVDDSEDSRELAALALEGAGLDVATAANGLEGVIFAHYALPIVILMDITMPVLNGFEAARLLKASPTTHQSHVLAYTAQPESCEGPLRRFFVDVVAKPAAPDLLLRRVQRVIDGTVPGERNE